MARARKQHVQEEMRFPTWGGKREGAGRKPKGAKAGASHRARETFEKPRAVHVTVRVMKGLESLRRREAYHAFRLAMYGVLKRDDFRVVHASLEHDHAHFVVEANTNEALANGMRALEISAAKRLNAAFKKHGVRRHGKVFPERYHAVYLRSPTQARHALRYCLLNWRKHRQDEGIETMFWPVDFYSTGPSFRGWKECAHAEPPFGVPIEYKPLPAADPKTWLLAVGWTRAGGPFSLYDVPGSHRA